MARTPAPAPWSEQLDELRTAETNAADFWDAFFDVTRTDWAS